MSVPSKSEVLSWDSQRLADFLKRRNLTGCDSVVTRYNINGQRFLSMSENDLQRFPKIHAPLISKICQEINKEKRRFFPPIPAIRPSQPVPSYPQPPVEQQEDHQAWDSEEFSDDDDDYENPNSNDDGEASGGDYESPEGSDSDNSYEPPPTEPSEDTAQICPAKPMENSDYIDNNRTRGASRSHPPVPPERPGPGPPLPPVERPSVGLHVREERPIKRAPAPAVDRSTKPGTLERNPPAVAGGRGTSSLDRANHQPRGSTAPPFRLPAVELPADPMRIPKPSLPPLGVRRSASSITPGSAQNRHFDHRNEFHDDTARNQNSSNTFPMHTRNLSPRPPGSHGQPFQTDNVSPSRSLPAKLQEAMSDHRRSARAPPPKTTEKQDMDPAWYMGQIDRGQAESCLRRVNKDGTFLVRDSSNRSSNQPYTLVVLYQAKVYNIQIRRIQNGFVLGTGMKASETFERVSDIISQHKHMPLVLIDAKNRESSQQNQCALIYPAAY